MNWRVGTRSVGWYLGFSKEIVRVLLFFLLLCHHLWFGSSWWVRWLLVPALQLSLASRSHSARQEVRSKRKGTRTRTKTEETSISGLFRLDFLVVDKWTNGSHWRKEFCPKARSISFTVCMEFLSLRSKRLHNRECLGWKLVLTISDSVAIAKQECEPFKKK